MSPEQMVSKLDDVAQAIESFDKEVNERVHELEKQQEQGYEKFNTETHILVERKFLKNVLESLESIQNDSGYAADEAEESVSYAGNVASYCEGAQNAADNLHEDITTILSDDE